MTHLYQRPGSRAPVRWEPQYETLGKQAVESVAGAVESYPVDVTDTQAAQIREEYQRLVEEQSSGGSS